MKISYSKIYQAVTKVNSAFPLFCAVAKRIEKYFTTFKKVSLHTYKIQGI